MLSEKQQATEQIPEHIHACVLYHGRDAWMQQVLRLVELGSENHERVVVLVPEHNFEIVRDEIFQFCVSQGHIEIGIVDDLFSGWAELNISLCERKLSNGIERCARQGYRGLRVIADMSWLADQNLSGRQVETCIRSTARMVERFPLSVFAGFDRQKFSPRRLLHILPCYSSVWVNSQLSNNIYHTDEKWGANGTIQHDAMLDCVLSKFENDAGCLGRSELEGALRLLKQIIDSMGDGVIVTDREGSMSLFNQRAQEIIGYGPTEAPLDARVRKFGNYLPDMVTPYPVEELPVSKAIRGESVDQTEIFIRNERRPEGAWVSATGRPLLDTSGEIRGGVVVFRDISQKKKSEEIRMKLEARMAQTQKLESLGLLAGGIAHDFNNLLMGILGHAGIALEYASPENRERLLHIERTATHLASLTNQLLDFAGRGSFANKPIDLEQLVCELCGMIRPILSKKATLELDFCEETTVVIADPSQLRQIVMNLVTNASDALGESEGRISIATRKRLVSEQELQRAFTGGELEEGEYVSIIVSDTGQGISTEQLRKIFDPFFTTKSSGRGLGLASVLGLVSRHSGALLVESELGRGTSFEVLLPVSEEQPVARPTTKKLSRSNRARKASVLIIDDEDVVRTVASQILELSGYSVILADSAAKGLAVFKESCAEIDVVLLDISMPDMDGRELFTRLRSIDPNTHVVLSSGYSEAEMIGSSTLSELSGFLQKPYPPQKLTELLGELLG